MPKYFEIFQSLYKFFYFSSNFLVWSSFLHYYNLTSPNTNSHAPVIHWDLTTCWTHNCQPISALRRALGLLSRSLGTAGTSHTPHTHPPYTRRGSNHSMPAEKSFILSGAPFGEVVSEWSACVQCPGSRPVHHNKLTIFSHCQMTEDNPHVVLMTTY